MQNNQSHGEYPMAGFAELGAGDAPCQLREDLKRAEHLKDDFLAMLAHELRNPLAPILSALQILELSEQHSAGAIRARGILKRQVQQMVRLIDDLTAVSRNSHQPFESPCKTVPLPGKLERSLAAELLVERSAEQPAPDCPDTPVVYTDAAGDRPLRVLVVDDNADAAEALATLLDMMGHEVHIRQDGGEAVVASASLKPDVILLDIGLPVLSGYEAAPRIREQAGGENIFLIALTGYGQTEDKRRSIEAGFAHHLVKPVAPAHLEQLMLSARRHRDDRRAVPCTGGRS